MSLHVGATDSSTCSFVSIHALLTYVISTKSASSYGQIKATITGVTSIEEMHVTAGGFPSLVRSTGVSSVSGATGCGGMLSDRHRFPKSLCCLFVCKWP